MAAGDAFTRRGLRLLLPLLASIAVCALLSGTWLSMYGGAREEFLFGLALGGVIGVPHAVLLGMPFACWLRCRGRFDAVRMALGGFVIGGLPMGIATSPPIGFLVGVIGAASALAFFATSRWLHR